MLHGALLCQVNSRLDAVKKGDREHVVTEDNDLIVSRLE